MLLLLLEFLLVVLLLLLLVFIRRKILNQKFIIWSQFGEKRKKRVVLCMHRWGLDVEWCVLVFVCDYYASVCGCVLWFSNFVLLISGFHTIALFSVFRFLLDGACVTSVNGNDTPTTTTTKRNAVTFVLLPLLIVFFSWFDKCVRLCGASGWIHSIFYKIISFLMWITANQKIKSEIEN